VAGRKYRATRNENGTVNIHDVEIFGELSKGERGNAEAIGSEWMASAISTARMRESESFKYVCHTQHNGHGATAPAGYLRLSDVKKTTLGGKEIDALHADLVSVPAGVFQDIMDRKLPYRSVEINRLGQPEINTLALLSTSPPHFQFPVLDDSTIELNETADVPEPVAAFAALMDEHSLGGGDTETMKNLTLSYSGGALVATSDSGATFKASDTAEPRQGEFIITTPEGAFAATFEAGEDDSAKLQATIDTLTAEVDALKAAKPSDDGDKFAALQSENAKMSARLDVLAEADAERTEDKRTATRETAAIASLKDAGWHVPAKCAENIAKFAAEANEALLDDYVEEFKATRPKDPRSAAKISADAKNLVPEKFKDLSPDDLEEAGKFSSEFDDLSAAGLCRGMTREDYVDSQLNRTTVEA